MHYAIGDVHGCYDELIAMLKLIEEQDSDAVFFLIGDIVDRGPKVYELLEWSRHNITQDGKYQMILGNHEDMVIQWFDEGCRQDTRYEFRQDLERAGANNLEFIKQTVDFFKLLPLYKIVKAGNRKFILAHAWAPEDEYYEDDGPIWDERHIFLWERTRGRDYKSSKYTLIYGHTPTIDFSISGQAAIYKTANSYNIDCGCVYRYSGYYGRLAALCLENGKEFYI